MEREKKRIWELDALRGACILGMIVVHALFDVTFFGGRELNLPDWFWWIKDYGHILFILISGICVTFSARSFQRGATVFAAGLLISYITVFMDYVMGFTDLRIWFGILHMLGACMMLYPLFRKLPAWVQGAMGVGFTVLGYWLKNVKVPFDFLFFLGIRSETFYGGSDFFPLLPGLGWFLIGAFLGETVYRNRKTLFPAVRAENPILKFLQFCGQKSLIIYLAHQPVLILLTVILFA